MSSPGIPRVGSPTVSTSPLISNADDENDQLATRISAIVEEKFSNQDSDHIVEELYHILRGSGSKQNIEAPGKSSCRSIRRKYTNIVTEPKKSPSPCFQASDLEVEGLFNQCLQQNTSQDLLTEENVLSLLVLADRRKVEWLAKDCQQFIVGCLDADNILPTIESIAKLSDPLPELMNRCLTRVRAWVKEFTPEQCQMAQQIAETYHIAALNLICNETLRACFEKTHLDKAPITIWVYKDDLEKNKELLKTLFSQKNCWRCPLALEFPEAAENVAALVDLLENNQVVTILNLKSDTPFKDEDFEHLRNLNSSILYLKLNISGGVSSHGVEVLSDILQQKNTLEGLDLQPGSSGGIVLTKLSEALKVNTSLKVLTLWGRVENQGIKKLADALSINTSLVELKLISSKIDGEGVEHLCQGLKNNHTLQVLNLWLSKIGDRGAEHLATLLKENTSLRELNIDDNEIHIEGIKSLCKGLKNNQTLRVLNFGGNKFGDEGAKEVADVLVVNQTLQILKLGDVRISDLGVGFIADALSKNQALKCLFLRGCRIRKGLEKLAKAFFASPALKKLDLAFSGIQYKDVENLQIPPNKKLIYY